MDQMTGFASALTRLESALDKLERAAGGVHDAGEALTELEALRHKHRRLKDSTERAVADLDALIASRS
ncbi:hypothetical protein [Sphingosinicella microcystinivorans]|uniref:DUF4164 family protein n=1 Tax=Sphingosinicella microcystinivorans TaxID=335406 RepID=A0AAD1D6K4_SPHMI|nr:hypothetical protein [Sphingosinicella microcystinivorans]RKS91882.1 hypothetical protein DFR51_1456 [Sphingosinicella microcystinivorans]BBE34868.1 hypothetical protein SmB9_25260 [Sphingosinicella microcystinivorans]